MKAYQKMERCLLVGVQTPDQSDEDCKRSLEELERLVDTLGLEVAHRMTQKLKSPSAASVVGPGKLLEISDFTPGPGVITIETHKKETKAALKLKDQERIAPKKKRKKGEFDDLVSESEDDEDAEIEEWNDVPELTPARPKKPKEDRVDHVVFDCELTPTQIRNLEQALSVDIMDRTSVIVEIFHRHAQTPAARAQVEIARLTYLTPRIRKSGPGERQGGGVGAKGVGETKHELDRRRIRDRIAELKRELEVIHASAALRRSRRLDSMKVALVGYTNAGKSSLMQALTGSEVYVANKLFATLDTTVRTLRSQIKPKILVTDTVGFIQKLPHELVASFRSTLDEALDASLLLYVVDASDIHFRDQLKTTKEVLKEIDADGIEHILVLNKIDLLAKDDLDFLKREFPKSQFCSAKDPKKVQDLIVRLESVFEAKMIDRTFSIPFDRAKFRSLLHEHTRIVSEKTTEETYEITARALPGEFDRLEKLASEASGVRGGEV
jgi:GTPase